MKYLLLLLLISSPILSQVVYEPLHRDVYKFLSRLSQKGIIEFNDEIKPLSRSYILEKLKNLNPDSAGSKSNSIKLTTLEKQELEFYLRDYNLEQLLNVSESSKQSCYQATKQQCNQATKQSCDHSLLILDSSLKSCNLATLHQSAGEDSSIHLSAGAESSKQSSNKAAKHSMILAGYDDFNRLRLFSYSANLFKINISPIYGYEFGSIDKKSYSHRWNGLYFYGYLGKHIGFSFDFRDNKETGVDRTNAFTPVTGITLAKAYNNSIEYSEAKTTLSFNWDWGTITAGKDFLEWGHGESGKLVLSQKAPSFPFIRLDVKPVSWLRFNYFHGWLSSDVIDSNETYSLSWNSSQRILYREKYIASHTLTLTPLKELSISLGESIIYSDRLEISYLFPLMFYRLADHYLSKHNNDAGSNSQFFLNLSSRNYIPNTHLYGAIIIDEISIGEIFNPDKARNQLGFTLGGSVVDLPINNLILTIEYTRLYPFVYTNFIPTQTYQNASYNLGHWMGNNSDLIYASLNYRFIRGLQATLWGQYIRKGENGEVDMQYTLPSQAFLFGLDNYYSYVGAELKYEITHELFARGRFIYNKQSNELEEGLLQSRKYNEFYFEVYYGL